jgi:hypothetical protein
VTPVAEPKQQTLVEKADTLYLSLTYKIVSPATGGTLPRAATAEVIVQAPLNANFATVYRVQVVGMTRVADPAIVPAFYYHATSLASARVTPAGVNPAQYRCVVDLSAVTLQQAQEQDVVVHFQEEIGTSWRVQRSQDVKFATT